MTATTVTARQKADRRWQPDLSDAIILKLLADPANVAEQVPPEICHIAHYTLTSDQVAFTWADMRENFDRLRGLAEGVLTPAEVFDADELGSEPHSRALVLASAYFYEAQQILKHGRQNTTPDCTGTPVTHQNGATA